MNHLAPPLRAPMPVCNVDINKINFKMSNLITLNDIFYEKKNRPKTDIGVLYL